MGSCWTYFGWGGRMLQRGLWGGLLFFASLLVVLGIVWLTIRLSRRTTAPVNGADSLEIARRRLAAGEIDVAEYDAIRDRLAL